VQKYKILEKKNVRQWKIETTRTHDVSSGKTNKNRFSIKKVKINFKTFQKKNNIKTKVTKPIKNKKK